MDSRWWWWVVRLVAVVVDFFFSFVFFAMGLILGWLVTWF